MVGCDLIAFAPSPDRDPDGAKLHSALNAHLALDRAQRTRVLLVHGTAALSIPVWLLSAWPGWLSAASRRLLLASWVLSAGAALAALAIEWRWRRKRDSAAAQLRPDLPCGPRYEI